MNTKKIFTNIANSLSFYPEAIHFMTPIRVPIGEQFWSTNDYESKKRNR